MIYIYFTHNVSARRLLTSKLGFCVVALPYLCHQCLWKECFATLRKDPRHCLRGCIIQRANIDGNPPFAVLDVNL